MSRAYFEIWDAARHRLATEFGHEISLEIEPGRYLVAESGYLICEIRAIKTAGENTFYLVDAGFNNLARPILYGAYHPMAICPAMSEASRGVLDSDPCAKSSSAAPCANRATSSPRKKAASSPVARCPQADVGDFLVIGYAGAYGYVMASNYNSKPLVAEVLIENGTAEPGPPPAIVGRPHPRRIGIARIANPHPPCCSRRPPWRCG